MQKEIDQTHGNKDTSTVEQTYNIDPKTYHWTFHSIQFILKFLKLSIHTRGENKLWQDGDIFLFNHFARFEAIIPQYLIYQKTRRYSRSIATSELFTEDNIFSRLLIGLGGISNDADSLLYQVAKDILKNHKLVAFPEGGIVKDRQTLNKNGEYHIYSRSHDERRKQHTGPAVIALAVSIFKASIRVAHKKGNTKILNTWAKELGFKSAQKLIILSEKPTLIIPCCITFYPIRIGDNALKQTVEFFYSKIKKRITEELLIEGNLLLKDTDMDIQLGEAIVIEDYWTRWESKLLSIFSDAPPPSLLALLASNRNENTSWSTHLLKPTHRRNINKIRDAYMQAIYASLTLNIAHIAATIISHYIANGEGRISCRKLHTLIYLCIKELQSKTDLNFHKTLIKPTIYRSVLHSNSDSFKQFLSTIYSADLVLKKDRYYIFQKALLEEYGFDEIRYENPLSVYANEAAPIAEVGQALQTAISYTDSFKCEDFADKLFDDEVREYAWDVKFYQQSRFEELNAKQTMCLPQGPFRLIPKDHNNQSVVLTHGLLSSPGEILGLAEKLYSLGYIVLGTRLKGHATSPWDLHQTSWRDWLESVKQNIRIAQCYSDKIHLVGFSSGSLLGLYLAANNKVTSVIACSTPITFEDPLVKLAKIANLGNKIIKTISGSEGIFPFKENRAEHPHLNYKDIPISAINELLLLIDNTLPRLKKIARPTLLLQAENDPVVEASSLTFLLNNIAKEHREHQWISSNRHGILYENTDNCQQYIIDFIVKHSK